MAGLCSLIATCEANGVNPVDYLADVLLRVQTHAASGINELLPHNWTPPRLEPSTGGWSTANPKLPERDIHEPWPSGATAALDDNKEE